MRSTEFLGTVYLFDYFILLYIKNVDLPVNAIVKLISFIYSEYYFSLVDQLEL